MPQLRIGNHEFYEFYEFTNLRILPIYVLTKNEVKYHHNCPLGQFISKIGLNFQHVDW